MKLVRIYCTNFRSYSYSYSTVSFTIIQLVLWAGGMTRCYVTSGLCPASMSTRYLAQLLQRRLYLRVLYVVLWDNWETTLTEAIVVPRVNT